LKYKIKHNRCCGQIRFLGIRRFDVIDFSVQLVSPIPFTQENKKNMAQTSHIREVTSALSALRLTYHSTIQKIQ